MPCPRSRASSGANRNLFAAHESLQIIQLGFTVLRDQAPCLGRGVLPCKVGPALNGALRVPQSGGGFSGAGAGFATIRLGSCENVAVCIGGLCRRRSVIDCGAGTLQRPSHRFADGANREESNRAAKGANMTCSCAVAHPSQPNYLALFSGSTHGVRSNACPQHLRKADNPGHQLSKAGLSFIGYSESMPKIGFRGCISRRYVRKHNPWVNFGTLPAKHQLAFQHLPTRLPQLPTVAFVSPKMCHGMHDCSVRTGDRWMKKHFDRYARWAPRHNSLLIV